MNELSSEYQNKMIEAFVQKPEKTFWYQISFDLFNVNGVDTIKWKWSWWAFFGNFFFLLYRKQYIPSLVVFISSITLGMIPFGGILVAILVAILVGGYSTYFIYKGYKTKLNEVEKAIPSEDEAKRIETMNAIGGYHQWVIWVYGFFMLINIFVMGVFFFVASRYL